MAWASYRFAVTGDVCRGSVLPVSLSDPAQVTKALDVPQNWSLVAYLCLGLPAEEHLDPELERHHWEQRTDLKDVVFTR